jgi:hypothetical protein
MTCMGLSKCHSEKVRNLTLLLDESLRIEKTARYARGNSHLESLVVAGCEPKF